MRLYHQRYMVLVLNLVENDLMEILEMKIYVMNMIIIVKMTLNVQLKIVLLDVHILKKNLDVFQILIIILPTAAQLLYRNIVKKLNPVLQLI